LFETIIYFKSICVYFTHISTYKKLEMKEDVSVKRFEVVEKISKAIDYNSRRWNKEKIDRYLLRYDDKRII